MKRIDLDNVNDARKFLRGVRIADKKIDFLELESGKQINIEDLSDSEAIRYAKDIWFDFCGGKEGQPGNVSLEEDN